MCKLEGISIEAVSQVGDEASSEYNVCSVTENQHVVKIVSKLLICDSFNYNELI